MQSEIDAQVQITQTFGREAPKAAASYAETQAKDLRAAGNEAEAKKWDEGGAYRIALHTVIGGLAGGTEGALGAAATAAAAPLLNNLQGNVTAALKAAGASDTVANLAGQAVSTATAAGIGSIASGGSAAGAMTGVNGDLNNRQLHVDERRLIAALGKKQATQICNGDSACEARIGAYWTDLLEHVAEGLVDDTANAKNQAYINALIQTTKNPSSEGAVGGIENYLNNLTLAQRLLAPYLGQPIVVNGVQVTGDGAIQRYFSATTAQRADTGLNNFGSVPVTSIVPGMGLRDQNQLERFTVQNGSATPVHTLEEWLIGGKVGDAVTGIAANVWRSLEVKGAGEVAASAGGNISAQQVTEAGMGGTLTSTERTMLATLDSLPTSTAQGNVREFVVNNYFMRNGFQPLEGKCGSNCFDGVFVKGDTVYVVETKPLNADGTIKLAGPSVRQDGSQLGTQMSETWIDSAVKRLKNGSAEQQQTAATIQQAIDGVNGKALVKIVTGVDSKGMTMVRLQ